MPDTVQHNHIPAQRDVLLGGHAIHGLFHLNLDFGPIEKVEDTLRQHVEQVTKISADDLPKRLSLSKPQADLQNARLWEPLNGKGMALDDFYPYARQIMGAKADEATVCISLGLGREGKQALTQLLGGKPRLWRLRLGQAAQNRCRQNAIDLQFDNARLFLFRTGVVILDLSWHYSSRNGTLPADVVLEGNYLLSHGNHPTKAPAASEDGPAPLDPLQLLEVAQALLPQSWAQTAPLQPNRLLLHSVANVADGADEEGLLELGIRLSHRQTSDYRPKSQPLESHVLQPFPYLCHMLAPEGAASVILAEKVKPDASVSNDAEPKAGSVVGVDRAGSRFFENFVSSSGTNTYVPLFVASLHNHLWLLAQTEWLPARGQGGKRHEIHDLEEVYERTVEFRRFFYFPMISQISLHNAFYERSQEVFKIAERQRFLEQTTHDIAELLKARRTKWIGRISGAVAGVLVSHELLDIVSQSGLPGTMPNLRVWLADTAHASPTVIEPMVRLVERWDLIMFLGSVAGGLVGYWAAWYFDKSPKGE